MEQTIIIKNQKYTLVKQRDHNPVGVYFDANTYLRLGPKEILEKEMRMHVELLTLGFPVAKILEQGQVEAGFYYTEESLGTEHLGVMFGREFTNTGEVSKSSFAQLLSILKQFAEAQLKSVISSADRESFYYGINMEYLGQELPDLQLDLERAFVKVASQLSKFPFVLTHGDLNTYNILPGGVIDFGSSFHGPLGYDLVNVLFHNYNFPSKGDFELIRPFVFGTEQRLQYLKSLDELFESKSLPKPSLFLSDFYFCKLVWATARIHHLPRMQAWRYKRFKVLLSMYLKGENIIDFILQS